MRILTIFLLVTFASNAWASVFVGMDGRRLSYSIPPDFDLVVITGASGTSWDETSAVNGSSSQNSYYGNNPPGTTGLPGQPMLYGSGSASIGPTSPDHGFVHSIYEGIFGFSSPVDATLRGTLGCVDYLGIYDGAYVALYEWDNGVETLVYEKSCDNAGSDEFSYSANLSGNYRIYLHAVGGNDVPAFASLSGSWEFELIKDPFAVSIDVLPGDAANKVYPNKTGKLPVAILSTDFLGPPPRFDATQVDPTTLKFGSAEASAVDPLIVSNVDGLYGDDVTTTFYIQESGIFCNDTEVTLTGETYEGHQFIGVDTIDATECKTGGCHVY